MATVNEHYLEGCETVLFLNLIISVLLLVFSGYIIFLGVNIPVGLANNFAVSAGAFPTLMGVLLMILSIWWLIDTLMEMRRESRNPAGGEKPSALDEIFGGKKQLVNLLLISAMILLYVFLLIPVCGGFTRQYGFTIASFIFLTVSIKVFNDISLVKTLLISAVTAVLIFVVFHHGLSVVMPT